MPLLCNLGDPRLTMPLPDVWQPHLVEHIEAAAIWQ
jgi:hypothetical protein